MNKFVENYSLMKSIDEGLNRYIEFTNRRTYKPQSADWFAGRSERVGCSELRKACGTLNEREDIINAKLYGMDLSRIKPVVWGNIFESSSQLMCELVLGTKIYNMNGSIHHSSGYIACSPDGVGVVKIPTEYIKDILYKKARHHCTSTKTRNVHIDPMPLVHPGICVDNFRPRKQDWEPTQMSKENYYDEVELIALYEFKSPYSRIMEHDKIKPEYLFQVLGGIDVIRPVYGIGVFAEVWFEESIPLLDIGLAIYDQHRGTQNTIYFASCKYIVMKNFTSQKMVPFEIDMVLGMKFMTDYEVVDGPYFFRYGDKVIFNENGFGEKYSIPDIPKPYDVSTLNRYFARLNEHLNAQINKPNYSYIYQLKNMSIKYVSGLEGFADTLSPHCKDLITEVKLRQGTTDCR